MSMLFKCLFKESERQLSSWQILIGSYNIVMGMNEIMCAKETGQRSKICMEEVNSVGLAAFIKG